MSRLTVLVLLCVSFSLACDPESISLLEDMGSTPLDMSADVDSREDMPEEVPDQAQDASADLPAPDLGPDMPEDMGGGCEGACKEQDLAITFGPKTRPLSRAVYGLNAPEQDGQPWTIHVEAHEGLVERCPEGPSSPEYTMIVSGVPILEDEMPVTKEMLPDLNVVLFDFVGDLVPDAPFRTRAETITVSARALSVCEECVGMPAPSDEDGYVALTIEAQFPEGTVSGNLYAQHCDNMDRIAP